MHNPPIKPLCVNIMIKALIFFVILLASFACKKQTAIIESELYSPDSSKVIVTYYYDNGAFGQTRDFVSIIGNGDHLPASGNLFSDSYSPTFNWISNDTIEIGCRPSILDEIKDWAVPKWNGIIFTFYNVNPPIYLHKKYYFSNYQLASDSTITFQSSLKNFLYYMKLDCDYTFPLKSLKKIYSESRIDKIVIKDDILIYKNIEIAKDRNIRIAYIAKFELIPSGLENEKINWLVNNLQ